MARLWDKGISLDERILRFTAGEDHRLDARLVPYDVRASIAHVRMLQAQGLLSAADSDAICAGLEALATTHARGEWTIELDDEDVHGALERRLIEKIGAAGGRVHLGRSRNDQVLAALRLYLKDAVEEIAAATARVVDSLAALGFAAVQEPVTAVQLSRGKAEASVIFELALLVGDLGRLAADLILFYTDEYAFVALPAEMTTGSSIMPQKRNPDVFELVRSSPATIHGALIESLAITAKLTSGYHRDLQRLKAPLFRSIDLGWDCAAIMAHALPGVLFRPENIVLADELDAAERANELAVKEGLPFRDAYRKVAATLAKKKK